MRIAPASRKSANVVLTTLLAILAMLVISGWEKQEAEAYYYYGSCYGACGSYAGSCWCDDACDIYGDCCSDKYYYCGGGIGGCQTDYSGKIQCCSGADAAYGEGCQAVGYTVEDAEGTTGFGECYGQCGAGCSWANCGSGGACETHDYYLRTYGFWSSQQFASFPAAAIQWTGCVIGSTVKWVTTKIVSAVKKVGSWISKGLKKIFN